MAEGGKQKSGTKYGGPTLSVMDVCQDSDPADLDGDSPQHDAITHAPIDESTVDARPHTVEPHPHRNTRTNHRPRHSELGRGPRISSPAARNQAGGDQLHTATYVPTTSAAIPIEKEDVKANSMAWLNMSTNNPLQDTFVGFTLRYLFTKHDGARVDQLLRHHVWGKAFKKGIFTEKNGMTYTLWPATQVIVGAVQGEEKITPTLKRELKLYVACVTETLQWAVQNPVLRDADGSPKPWPQAKTITTLLVPDVRAATPVTTQRAMGQPQVQAPAPQNSRTAAPRRRFVGECGNDEETTKRTTSDQGDDWASDIQLSEWDDTSRTITPDARFNRSQNQARHRRWITV